MSKDQDFGSKPGAREPTMLNGKNAANQPLSEITAAPPIVPAQTRPLAPWGRPVSESVAHYAARRAARECTNINDETAHVAATSAIANQAEQAQRKEPENWGPEACLAALECQGLGDSTLAQVLRADLENPHPYKTDTKISITATLIGTPKDYPSREK